MAEFHTMLFFSFIFLIFSIFHVNGFIPNNLHHNFRFIPQRSLQKTCNKIPSITNLASDNQPITNYQDNHHSGKQNHEVDKTGEKPSLFLQNLILLENAKRNSFDPEVRAIFKDFSKIILKPEDNVYFIQALQKWKTYPFTVDEIIVIFQLFYRFGFNIRNPLDKQIIDFWIERFLHASCYHFHQFLNFFLMMKKLRYSYASLTPTAASAFLIILRNLSGIQTLSSSQYMELFINLLGIHFPWDIVPPEVKDKFHKKLSTFVVHLKHSNELFSLLAAFGKLRVLGLENQRAFYELVEHAVSRISLTPGTTFPVNSSSIDHYRQEAIRAFKSMMLTTLTINAEFYQDRYNPEEKSRKSRANNYTEIIPDTFHQTLLAKYDELWEYIGPSNQSFIFLKFQEFGIPWNEYPSSLKMKITNYIYKQLENLPNSTSFVQYQYTGFCSLMTALRNIKMPFLHPMYDANNNHALEGIPPLKTIFLKRFQEYFGKKMEIIHENHQSNHLATNSTTVDNVPSIVRTQTNAFGYIVQSIGVVYQDLLSQNFSHEQIFPSEQYHPLLVAIWHGIEKCSTSLNMLEWNAIIHGLFLLNLPWSSFPYPVQKALGRKFHFFSYFPIRNQTADAHRSTH